MSRIAKARTFYPRGQSVPEVPRPGQVKVAPSLATQFVPSFSLSAGMPAAGIPTTPLAGRALAAGEAWWFVLADVVVGKNSQLSDGFAVGAIRVVQASPDVKGVGFANAPNSGTPWGDIFGNGAALVVMVDPPLREKFGASNIYRGPDMSLPGLSGVAPAGAPILGDEGGQLVWWDTFPPGTMGDGTAQNPAKRTTVENYGQYPRNVPSGSRLVVAVLVGASANGNPGIAPLFGIGHVVMTCGKLTQTNAYATKPG